MSKVTARFVVLFLALCSINTSVAQKTHEATTREFTELSSEFAMCPKVVKERVPDCAMLVLSTRSGQLYTCYCDGNVKPVSELTIAPERRETALRSSVTIEKVIDSGDRLGDPCQIYYIGNKKKQTCW